MPRLSDFQGESVGSALGDEARYFCLVCGTKSLFANYNKHVWFCHTCSVGGRIAVDGAGTDTLVTIEHLAPVKQSQYVYDSVPDMMKDANWTKFELPVGDFTQRNIPYEVLDKLGCWVRFIETANGQLIHSLVLPMKDRSDCIVAGQLYTHNSKYGKEYHTHGTKGFARYGVGASLVILEGMFDFLSLAKLVTEDMSMSLFYSAGNTLNVHQKHWLFEMANQYDRVVIGFDNDKVAPQVKLAHQLRLFGCPQVCLWSPPVVVNGESCKDWDEAVQADQYYVEHELSRLSDV